MKLGWGWKDGGEAFGKKLLMEVQICAVNGAEPSSQGHHREVWCLAISPNGDHLVTASHDKSLRLWERTREPVILEEEREMVRRAGPAWDAASCPSASSY